MPPSPSNDPSPNNAPPADAPPAYEPGERRLRIAAELHAATLPAVLQTGLDAVRQIAEIYWERVEGRHFADEAALDFVADHLAIVRALAREDADALAGSVMGLQLQALGRGSAGSPPADPDAGAPNAGDPNAGDPNAGDPNAGDRSQGRRSRGSHE